MKRINKYLLWFLLILTSCGSSKQVAIVDHVAHDTVYMNKLQYDSVYIYHERTYEPLDSTTANLPPSMGGPGRVFDSIVEYRYKLLRDTIHIHEVDSIPVIQKVEVERQVPRPRTTFDIISYWCFGIVICLLLLTAIRVARKLL